LRESLKCIPGWQVDVSTKKKYMDQSVIIDDQDFDKYYLEILAKIDLIDYLLGKCKRYKNMPREFIIYYGE